MRAVACSVAVAVAAIPWMAGCAVGAGDEGSLPAVVDGGDASVADGSGSDVAKGGDGAMGGGDATVADRAIPLGDGGQASNEGGSVIGVTDASPGDATTDSPSATGATTSTLAGLRVANWSPGAPPIDFCIAPHGTGAFGVPVMAAAAGDGGVGQLPFTKMSAYLLLPPSAYDVRIVIGAPGADCSLGNLLVKDTTVPNAGIPGSLALVAGSNTTVALVGELQGTNANGPRLQVLTDDVNGPSAKISADAAPIDRFALRFVHAAPGIGAVGLGTGSAANGIKTLLDNVGFISQTSQAKDGGGMDPNGYVTQSAWTAKPVHVWLSAKESDAGPAPDLVPSPSVTAAGRSVVTLVLAGDPAIAVQLIECVDDAATTAAYSACKTISVSTCGNGRRDPFEECDCSPTPAGAQTIPSTDVQCVGNEGNNNGPLPQICSTSCRLN